MTTILAQTDEIRNARRKQTEAANFANMCRDSARAHNRFQAMHAKSVAADPNFNFDTGLLLAV